MKIFRDFFSMAANGNMGTQLFPLFGATGFRAPDCRAEYPMGGGADNPFYEWISEAVRSILPRAKALGIPGAEDIEIETLEQRLRGECVANGSCLPGPTMVGGFAFRP